MDGAGYGFQRRAKKPLWELTGPAEKSHGLTQIWAERTGALLVAQKKANRQHIAAKRGATLQITKLKRREIEKYAGMLLALFLFHVPSLCATVTPSK